ncbi:MAG TPA: trehalose-phosphatase [Burkholderiaceae bacterium]|nr:trehalose-phosphatase [Burkholderiaceae bacterium]
MRHLFKAEGRRALDAALRARPLLAFDFDGTLAPIVERPDDARVAPEVSERLDRLARLRPVAVVTGRSVADVSRRLGFSPRFVVGNHGAEDPAREPGPETSLLDGLRAHLAAHAAGLGAAGVQVEDKRFSLSLHYRLAHDRRRAVARIRSLLRGLDPGLRTFGGKCVINVVLASAPDKGDAVAALVQRAQCGAAVFVGDDVNDEAVFERALPNWVTVRVGRDDPATLARFFLSDHSEMGALLDAMLGTLRTPPFE